jgi:hypothetical protein
MNLFKLLKNKTSDVKTTPDVSIFLFIISFTYKLMSFTPTLLIAFYFPLQFVPYQEQLPILHR